MVGWEKQYDGKFWMDPLLEELVVVHSNRFMKKISGKESDYTAEFIVAGKNRSFTCFRHALGIKEDSEYYYNLYVKKAFINTLRKLFNKYASEERKSRMKTFYGKKPLTYSTAKKYFFQGYVLSKFTDPGVLTLIENKIKDLAEKKLHGDKAILLDLDSHQEPNIFKREEKDLLELALLIKHRKPYKDKMQQIIHSYGLLKYVKRHRPLSKIYFKKRALEKASLSEKEITRLMHEISNFTSTHTKNRNSLFKKYGFTKEEKHILEAHAEIAHIRLELRALWLPYYCELHEILKREAKRKGMHKYTLTNTTVEQLEHYFKTGKILKKLPKLKHVLIYKERDKAQVFYNNDALKKIKQFDIPLQVKHSSIVKGDIANKGFIEGKVRVLNWDIHFQKNMKEMKQGEILVVTQTKPDMMEAIRKASGIITNEGGMISHAAIISRELKIPCLMGTGYATEYFKTGDHVVLDCEKGEAYKK